MGILQDLEKLIKKIEGLNLEATIASINTKAAELETRLNTVEKAVGVAAPAVEGAVLSAATAVEGAAEQAKEAVLQTPATPTKSS
jgi:hypothetical protein